MKSTCYCMPGNVYRDYTGVFDAAASLVMGYS